MPVSSPPAEALREFLGPTTRHTRRVEIYESDGKTRWKKDIVPRIKSGSVSVDYDRDERRSVDLVFSNDDHALINAPGEFWYDKILKVYRGVQINSPVRLPRVLILSDSTTDPQAAAFRAALTDLGFGDVQINTLANDYVIDMSGFDVMVALGDQDKGALLNQAYLAGKSVWAFRRGAEYFLNAMLGTTSWANESKSAGQKKERRRNQYGFRYNSYFDPTITVDSANQYYARNSYKVLANNTNPVGIIFWTPLSAAAGQVVTARFAIKSSVAGSVDIGGRTNNAGEYLNGKTVAVPANTWVEFTHTWTTQLSTATGTPDLQGLQVVWATPKASGNIMYVSQPTIELGPTVGAFFDGATTDTATMDYQWTGTAGASQSIMVSEYITTRINYADNGRPSGGSGWSGTSGTSGVTATSTPTDGSPSGGNYFRRTWTTASTAVGGGSFYGTAGDTVDPYVMEVAPGERVYASGWHRSSIAQRIGFYLQYYNAAGAQIGNSAMTTKVQNAAEWTFYELDVIVPANAVRCVVTAYAVAGASAVVWPVNSTLDSSAYMFQRAVTDQTVHNWFDGATVASLDNRYEWDGTAYASVAYERNLDAAIITPRNIADPRTAAWTMFYPEATTENYKAPATSITNLFGVSFSAQSTASYSITSSENAVGGRFIGVHFPINTYQYADLNFQQFMFAAIQWLNPVVPLEMWETQIGEFMIDRISEPHFPYEVKITGRDYTKKCMLSKFSEATQFDIGLSLETLVSSLAYNAGIKKQLLPATNIVIGQTFFFERGSSRWDAMKEVCTAYNYEIFFDATGYLVIRPFRDPSTSAPTLYVETGKAGQLATYTKSTSDASLFNHVLVTGESSDATLIPVYAEARNLNPASPTSIDAIGDRYWEFVSAFITDVNQAYALAVSYLSVKSLEEFELTFDSLLLPWVEVGDIMGWKDPNPAPGDPTTFLLSSITLPLSLGPMSGVGRRVTSVGDITTSFTKNTRWSDVAPSTRWTDVPDTLKYSDMS